MAVITFNPFTGGFDVSPALAFPGTLVIASGKTATINNTLTFAGTDATTMTFPATSAMMARTDAANTFTLANDTTNVIAGGSVTGSGTSSFWTLSGTWNTSGTPAAALLVNITNTASAGTAKLADFQIAGTPKAWIDKNGSIAGNQYVNFASSSTGMYFSSANVVAFATAGATNVQISGTALALVAGFPITWSGDVSIVRDAAHVLALKDGTNANTFRIYETADAGLSNYSRLAISTPTGGPITFASEAAGTGTARTMLFSNPLGAYTFGGSVGNSVTLTGSAYLELVATSADVFLTVGGTRVADIQSTGFAIINNKLGFSTGATSAPDAFFTRGAAAVIQLGADVNGAATAQTLQAANAITGSNLAGGNLTLRPGAGMGTGTVSSFIVQTPTIAASGANTQAQADRLTISSAGAVFTGPITTLGGATFHTTSSALTDGVGASAGTITNAPSIGNPTKWIGINDNGTTRYIPAW